MFVMTIKRWGPKEVFFTQTLHKSDPIVGDENYAKRQATMMAKAVASTLDNTVIADDITRIADKQKWKSYSDNLFVKTHKDSEYSIELRPKGTS